MKKVILFGMLLTLVISSCKKSEDDGPSTDPQVIGIVGEWYSSGTNVAPLLVTFGVDSLYAKFNLDNTYLVESFSSGAKTTLTGTYTQEKSGTGNIWNITVNQTSPTALTSEGIFEISTATNPYTMKYEVVQTQPATGFAAPTAAAGFGSTADGAFGTTNIQNYIKIVN